MSRGQQQLEEPEGEEARTPSGGSESSMMDMFRMLMQENREAEAAREKKRDKKEKDDAKTQHTRQLELAKEQHAREREATKEAHERLLELKEREREAEELKVRREREVEELKVKREREAEELKLKNEELKVMREREAEELKLKKQEAYEARQLEQQLALVKAQVEMGEKANRIHREGQDLDRNRSRVLTSIAEWKEGEDLEEFFAMAEGRMGTVGIKEEEWVGIIDLKLKGKMSMAWQNAVKLAGGYWDAKGKILKICGYTPKAAAEGFFGFKADQCKGLTAVQLFHEGQQLMRRLLAPTKISEEAEFAFMKGWIFHVVPKGARRVLDARPLGSGTELVDALQDYLSLEGDCKFGQASTFKGELTGQGERPRERFGPLVCFKCGKNGHKAVDCWQAGGAGQQRAPIGEGIVSKINCFTCGVEGHKSPQCPKNVRGERQGGKEGQVDKAKPVMRIMNGQVEGQQVKGSVNGWDTLVLLDSGADITLVPEALVSPSQLTGGTVAVKGYGATHSWLLPTAEVRFRIEGSEWIEVVGVVPRRKGVKEEVIYSLDLRSQRGFALAQLLHEETPREVMRVTTRAEDKREQQEAEAERAELAACSPEVTLLPGGCDVRNEPGVEVEPDEAEVVGREGEDEEAEEVEVNSQDLVESGQKEASFVPEWDIPVVRKGGGDKEALMAETKRDPSLELWRKLADKGEEGFVWEKGLLYQEVMTQVLEKGLVLVLPKSFRHKVLVIAHDKMQHMGARRVTKLVKQRFTWPGAGKDIADFCRACPVCQKCDKLKSRKALMIERPVMSEPFEVIAIDLVGPFKAGKGGCTHLLTAVCMATRWPEAIPLRSITARSVTTGLLDIFSRSGIPLQLLSDQGAQFTGNVLKHLCDGLHIDQIMTTPYHPEGNGVVERMHGPLCAMLTKAAREGHDWVGQVPFALFALRAAPNRDTGFSPFELVYGRRVRTPLDVLHQGWAQEEFEDLNCSEWADWLVTKLECWHDVMRERGAEASKRRKEDFDKKAVCRELELGDLVLIRKPGLIAKLEESWQGPFPVVEKLNKVNYRVETSKGRAGVLHINNLKKYHERELEVLRLAVVAEDFGQDEAKGVKLQGTCEGFDEEQWKVIEKEFEDVFTDVPGQTSVCQLVIETGDAQPIASGPHRVPDRLKEGVRLEVAKLVEMGVVEESTSPWASPIVPVPKDDGSIRLCIDYRRLNGVSQADPYYMATLEEILERVGSSKCISKLDLSKGFYQIEVEKESIPKTAFITPFGKFQFLRMPFGLRNAPSIFQRVMECVLRGCYMFSAPYIDDIVVFSQDGEAHLTDLREVLIALRTNGLTVKLEKCAFGKRKLEYLGHLIGGGEMAVPEHRGTAMAEFVQPRTKKQLRAFLGSASYYRRFVHNFATYSSLLSPNTSKFSPSVVVWTGEMLEAFHTLRVSLVNVCILTVPSLEDCFVLHSDASGAGIGAALYVVRNEEEKLVAFFSKQLQGAQSRYSATELEALAVFKSIHFFAHYLWGKKFKVVTDHRALVYLMTSNKLNKRLTGWALQLMDFQFEICYKPGNTHQDADGMSRQGWSELDGEDSQTRTSGIKVGGDVGMSPTRSEQLAAEAALMQESSKPLGLRENSP